MILNRLISTEVNDKASKLSGSKNEDDAFHINLSIESRRWWKKTLQVNQLRYKNGNLKTLNDS